MHKNQILFFALILAAVVAVSGCSSTPAPSAQASATSAPVTGGPAGSHTPAAADTASAGGLSVRVGALVPGSALPDGHTCKGASESPGVFWDGIPAGTKSLVLILDDPDAPAGTFTHWIVYNIPPQNGNLPAAQPNAKVLANGANQGETSAGSRGYYPPCPPVGSTHRYVFRLYAVDMDITQPTANRESIDWALTGHTLANAEFVTRVTR